MNSRFLHIILRTLLIAALALPAQSLSAAYSRHATSIVQTLIPRWNYTDYTIQNIIGEGDTAPDKDAIFFSGVTLTADADKQNFIRVILRDNSMPKDDDGDMVVYLRRTKTIESTDENLLHINNAQPVAFGVKAMYYISGTSDIKMCKDYLFNVYFQYRGPSTEEYSTRIPIKKIWDELSFDPSITKIESLIFYPLATNYIELFQTSASTFVPIALNSFDVLKIPHDEPYSDTWADRFHLGEDYHSNFNNYTFINTRGIADDHNSIPGWQMLDEGEIARLQGMGITYPDYSMLTSGSSALRNPYPIEPGQERQPTHTVEHTVYVMPGDIVPLYPYYGLPFTINFKENFIHWYDFAGGGRIEHETPWNGEKVDLLDFLVDPSGIQRTNDYGFFGGKYMAFGKKINVSTVDEYIDAVNYVNNNGHNEYINITADLDFSGRTNVPMIGDEWERRFRGVLNGNGHTISNLVINTPNVGQVGIISRSDGGAVLENLIIDNTCSFTGKRDVGIIGYHAYNHLTISNVHTEATIQATGGQCGGLVGYAAGGSSSLTIEECYVGGDIGSAGQTENAALIGWLNTSEHNVTRLKNVLVNCTVAGSDGNMNRKYIRSNNNSQPLTTDANGTKIRGDLRFINCHGYLDPSDKAWIKIPIQRTLPAEYLTKLGWSDQKTPPMSTNLTLNDYNSYEYYGYYVNNKYIIGDEADYINKINEFNSKTGTYYRAYIELTQDLDFSAYGPEDVPMIGTGKDKEFAGLFNGNGHTIKNLRIVRNQDGVGMFGFTSMGAHIENLIIDSSCRFEGRSHVGLVGEHRWNRLYFRNIKTEATVIGNNNGDQYAAAIVGYSNGGWSDKGTFDIENVYIGGVIGNPDDPNTRNNAVICAWQSGHWIQSTLEFKNIVVDCELYGADKNKRKYIRFANPDAPITMDGETYVKSTTYTVVESVTEDGEEIKKDLTYSLRYTNCYGNIDPEDIPWRLMDEEYELPEMEGWTGTYPTTRKGNGEIYALNGGNGDRSAGTVATFFCPRNPFNTESAQNLPKDEYVIAADISHTYNPDKNLDMDAQEIYEPIISSRHIFRIRDGKTFADETSGSVESNRNYLRKNRKFVTLQKGSQWQIRLDNPVPITNSNASGYKWAPSHYYYIDDNNNYHRVPQLNYVIRDAETNSITSSFSCSFTNKIPGYGCREVDGVKYASGEAYFESLGKHPDYHGSEYNSEYEYEYNTMISGTANNSGHYLVQIVACDYRGNQIKIKGTESPLVLMEYDFTVQDAAFMERMDRLYSDEKYSEYTPEALDKKYGSPTVKIDFDEYMAINSLEDSDPLKAKLISHSTYLQTGTQTSNPGEDATDTENGMQKTWFKWPVPWTQSSYMFGYNDRYDYSMYQLASHSDNVVWKWKAMEFSEADDPTSMTGNYPGDGKGLFDRRYYASKLNGKSRATAEQGYFYYVNAASDPGVTASLRINDICQGSRLVVSAWISEFSQASEKANLSFNFVAVLKDDVAKNYPDSKFVNGQRIILHKYITGYPSEAGKWYNVYYSFLPRLAEFSAQGVTTDMVDHYELELDNNAKNSNGADYAVDDIRAYVVPPKSEITQLHPACDGYATRMKLSTPFYTLLELARMPEAAAGESTKDMNVYFTILDKEEYDNAKKENKSYEEAFNSSVVAFHVSGSDSEGATSVKHYDEVTFKSRYNANPEYKYDPDAAITQSAFREEKKGERMIVFESDVMAGVLTPGKSYYFILRSPLADENIVEGQEYLFFDMEDPCANFSEVNVQGSLVVKWEGEMVTNIKDYLICPNQYPVIQVDIIGKDPEHEGETKPMETNAFIDWFHGTYNEFMAYCEEGNPEHTLREALGVFRIYYPENTNLIGVVPQRKENEEWFEEWMIDLLVKATTPTEEQPVAPLTLYESSYVVPAVTIPEGETEIKKTIVAIQRNCDYGQYWVCADPQEIQMTVRNVSPLMLHGLPEIEYPAAMTDVPLRIGLDQIRSDNGEQGFTMKSIDIPVRIAQTTTSEKKFILATQTLRIPNADNVIENVEKTGAVILVKTADPEYKDLGIGAYDEPEQADLLWVGDVTKLNVTAGNTKDQYFTVVFRKNFNFKEGYEYMMRFQYEVENQSAGIDAGVCQGHDVFTLKIVPKYLLWTGDLNLNWNNDANWRRVSANELYSAKKENEHRHYVTDGLNNNVSAFAPLDFTHVIVDGYENEAPYMYAPSETETIADDYYSTKTHSWPKTPNKGSSPTYADDPGAEGVGSTTALIHYDMAAFDFVSNDGRNAAHTGCRPWYVNTCKEIHFKPGGTLMNQHELTYEKAWVDVEVDPMRWYTLSLPLKEVFAGDFYLPTANARQETELYQDIRFSQTLNDRFRPAVFQRGWDKSAARVYELEHPGFDSPRNVAVRAFWSHVYNDVTEEYGAGVGFSVKTDVSRLGSNWSDRVMFRFPKADEKYLYFNEGGDKSGHETTITRTEAKYRLSDHQGKIKAATATPGNYFLVGNPFITHFDIAKFLKANETVLEQKYWIVTANGQIAGSVGEGNNFVALPTPADDEEAITDPDVVAPMQGFFVKTKTATNNIELRYDESMMRRYGSTKEHLTSTARAEGVEPFKITAYNYGMPSSAAIVVPCKEVSADVEAFDNRDIDVASTVYTVKGNSALSVNIMEDMEGMEIGLIADEDTKTILRFEGVTAPAYDLCLYDKADGSITQLEEGMEIEVTGPIAGRLFLTAGIPDEKLTSGIEWAIYDGKLYVTDSARSGCLSVKVCDIAGRIVTSVSVDADSVEIPLAPGIYLAEIVTANERKCVKVRI